MSEHICHRGEAWKQIAPDLVGDDEFARHLYQKADESCRRFGPARPFGETVTDVQASRIRKSAHERGFPEIKGDAG